MANIITTGNLKRIAFKAPKEEGDGPQVELTISIDFSSDLRRLVNYVGKPMRISFESAQMALPMGDGEGVPKDFARAFPGGAP